MNMMMSDDELRREMWTIGFDVISILRELYK
jgi:hypothetical protein